MPKAPKAKVGQGKKPIHPNSRKAMVLARNISHDKRLQKSKKERISKLDVFVGKLQWFKDELDSMEELSSKAEFAKIVMKYLQRFQAELNQIDIINSIGNRKGQRHASREASIKMTINMEKSDFDGNGIEVPDILDSENVEILRNWDGRYSYVQKIKMTKISARDLDSEDQAALLSDNKTSVSSAPESLLEDGSDDDDDDDAGYLDDTEDDLLSLSDSNEEMDREMVAESK